jgi:hypothetical protein
MRVARKSVPNFIIKKLFEKFQAKKLSKKYNRLQTRATSLNLNSM